MSFPQAPCSHHRRGGPLVCQRCSMLRYMGGSDAMLDAERSDAFTRQYRQNPATATQIRDDMASLRRQRPTPNMVYGNDRTVADNIIGGGVSAQSMNDYPYPTGIPDSDLFGGDPSPVRRAPSQQPTPEQAQPAARSRPEYQPSPNQLDSRRPPGTRDTYRSSSNQPNGANVLSMPNGTYLPLQRSERRHPSQPNWMRSPTGYPYPTPGRRDRDYRGSTRDGFVSDSESDNDDGQDYRRRRQGRR